ncbi:alpha and gamma adaptin binding protein p34 [Colletotrichum graminicola]|nr:alpha and gamma adaptin binding protein p34 [Colletotrichum graminicola]
MDIKNPRRVLAVSLADSKQHLSRVIKDLTGNHPEPASTTLAGTTHVLSIKTSYYSADVPIWLDLISSPAEWSESFLSPEAKEVLSVLGGMAVVFALPSTSSSGTAAPVADTFPVTATEPAAPPAPPSADETRALITEVGRVVREGLGGWGWDGVSLGIGVGDGDADEWEELCAEWGLEFVQVRGGKKDEGKNEFGGSWVDPSFLSFLDFFYYYFNAPSPLSLSSLIPSLWPGTWRAVLLRMNDDTENGPVLTRWPRENGHPPSPRGPGVQRLGRCRRPRRRALRPRL